MKSKELEEYARMRLCGLDAVNVPDPPVQVNAPATDPTNDWDDVGTIKDVTQHSSQVSLRNIREVSDEALYTYGQWPVVIAERAINQLHQLNKTDPAIFKAVERKIK